MEVSVTDLLSLFLTKIYVLVFFAFNILFLEKQRKTEFYGYHAWTVITILISQQPEQVISSTSSPPMSSTHPVPDPRELRLFKGKRHGMRDSDVSWRMCALFYAYKTGTDHPPSPKAQSSIIVWCWIKETWQRVEFQSLRPFVSRTGKGV